jgi:hypothetical protein
MSFANNTSHMLLILIPIAWLTVVTVFVAAGRTAARGDAAVPPVPMREQSLRTTPVDGLTLWEDPVEVDLQDMRRHRPRRLAGHGLPHHGVR